MSEFLPGSGLLDAPWDEKGDPEINLARKAREAGYSAKQYVKMRSDAMRVTARVLHWDSGMMDQAMLALAAIVAQTWGPIEK